MNAPMTKVEITTAATSPGTSRRKRDVAKKIAFGLLSQLMAIKKPEMAKKQLTECSPSVRPVHAWPGSLDACPVKPMLIVCDTTTKTDSSSRITPKLS